MCDIPWSCHSLWQKYPAYKGLKIAPTESSTIQAAKRNQCSKTPKDRSKSRSIYMSRTENPSIKCLLEEHITSLKIGKSRYWLPVPINHYWVKSGCVLGYGFYAALKDTNRSCYPKTQKHVLEDYKLAHPEIITNYIATYTSHMVQNFMHIMQKQLLFNIRIWPE